MTQNKISADARQVRGGRAGVAALLLAPLLFIVTAALMFDALAGVERQRRTLERSYETRTQIQRVFSLLQDAETGQRGYVITGQPAFLEPYNAARAQLDAQLAALDRRFADTPAQAARMAELRRLTDAKVSDMSAVIVLRQSQGAAAAAERVRLATGKRLMDAIRVVVAEMIAEESRRVAEGHDQAVTQGRQAQWIAGAVSLLLLASLLGAAVLLHRRDRARARLMAAVEWESTRQRAIFENTMDAIVLLNPSGSIETINRAAERMFGYERSELLRRDSATLVDFAPGEGLFLRRLAVRGDPALGEAREFTARHKDGHTFPVEVSLGAMRLRDGLHLVAALRDITERKAAERLKEEFVSTVSHELRTPMTSISASLGLMAGGAAGPLPDKAARLVHIAKTSCDRLVRLINDLLDMQKIAAGKMDLNMVELDLREVAGSAIEAIGGYARERKVSLALEAPAAPMRVRGDADRLVQVLVNFLSNAVKFSPEGAEVRLQIREDGERAVADVRDQGPGVPEAFQPSLFGRFAQANSSATRSTGGTGLGLAISREIAERHGGAVSLAESGPDGSVFRLALPMAASRPPQPPPRAADVLICEADPEMAAAMREGVEAQGFSAAVLPGADGLEAALGGGRYELLLLGLRLSEGNGLSVIQRLRGQGVALPPTIIVSGEPSGQFAGVPIADWITTPLDPTRLRRAVTDVLGDPSRVRILHLEDDVELAAVVGAALQGCGSLEAVHTLAEAMAAVRRRRPDLVILDIGLPDGSGLDLLPVLNDPAPGPPVIVYSGQEIEPELVQEVQAVLTKSRVSFDALTDTVRA
uniref:CHASE3 domain-containing protein n=1 Tax=Phenylobacterium sp. TaxID=1871053 RepID=UPI002811FF3E